MIGTQTTNTCFFCEKVCADDRRHTKKEIELFIKEHGHFDKAAGRIGKYCVCKSCASDIYGLTGE